jgi:hypothetical protein
MRTCGPCQQCCWQYVIPELDKPRRTNCKYQCAAGCAIHDQVRLPICTDFECCWKQFDWWPEGLRPDLCRVIFARHHIPNIGRRLFVGAQATPYGHWQKNVRSWAETLARRGDLVLFTYETDDGESEYASVVDTRRYPNIGAKQLIGLLYSMNPEAYKSVADYCQRQHGKE